MHYSLENANKFGWSSITGRLHPERVSHLESYVCGTRILDAGCGGGAYLDFLQQKGYNVTGIDRHHVFLQDARENHPAALYTQADICNLPFANRTFDCTYCFDVLEHVNDESAIAELARVTVRRLIVAVPKQDEVMSKYGLTFFHYQDQTHLRCYTETSLRQLLTRISHSNVDIFPELAVPAKALVTEMLEPVGPGLCSLRRRIFYYLLRKMLGYSSFKRVYTGLVAVVDL